VEFDKDKALRLGRKTPLQRYRLRTVWLNRGPEFLVDSELETSQKRPGSTGRQQHPGLC